MGYESRIYIVEKTRQMGYRNPHKEWAQVMMVFNLGRVSGELERWYRKQKPTDYFIYADDSNTEIVEDRVGDPLREIDLIDLRDALLAEMDRRSDYGNDQIHILAKSVLDRLIRYHGPRTKYIKCLHYGY